MLTYCQYEFNVAKPIILHWDVIFLHISLNIHHIGTRPQQKLSIIIGLILYHVLVTFLPLNFLVNRLHSVFASCEAGVTLGQHKPKNQTPAIQPEACHFTDWTTEAAKVHSMKSLMVHVRTRCRLTWLSNHQLITHTFIFLCHLKDMATKFIMVLITCKCLQSPVPLRFQM